MSASDRVRFGMIGVGMQGSGLLARSIALPGVECAAALRSRTTGATRARVKSPAPTCGRRAGIRSCSTTRRSTALSPRCPITGIEKIVVDAVSAGKDIYCEKPMSHSVADGRAMVAAAQKSGRIVQIGSQRTSSVLCAKARELVAQGVLGDLQLVEGSLGRNDPTGAWVYPPPPDLSPSTLDWDTWQGDVPKRPFDPKIFARWRCWKEYGTGVAGDLMVHLISGMLFTWGINEAPTRVVAMGGIRRFNDGRNMPDVHTSLFEYGDVPVHIRLNLASETPEVLPLPRIEGHPRARGDEPDVLQPGRRRYRPELLHGELSAGDAEAVRQAVARRARSQSQARNRCTTPSGTRDDSYDDTRPHLWKFFQAVKTRQPVVQDAVFGHHAAVACHMANESYFQKKPVTFDAATDTMQELTRREVVTAAGRPRSGIDGLAAREHGDQRRDLLRAPGWRFHVVGSKRQREQVLTTERAERLACARVGLDGGAKIRRESSLRSRCASAHRPRPSGHPPWRHPPAAGRAASCGRRRSAAPRDRD